MKRDRLECGFTLVESVASWTILLIAVTVFLKCINMAHITMGKGKDLRKQCMAALESAELEEEPAGIETIDLKFRMNKENYSIKAAVLEYGAAPDGRGNGTSVTLKVIVPAAKLKE